MGEDILWPLPGGDSLPTTYAHFSYTHTNTHNTHKRAHNTPHHIFRKIRKKRRRKGRKGRKERRWKDRESHSTHLLLLKSLWVFYDFILYLCVRIISMKKCWLYDVVRFPLGEALHVLDFHFFSLLDGLVNVTKLRSVIDSVRVLGQWVSGRTGGSLVEPHKPVCIYIILDVYIFIYIYV